MIVVTLTSREAARIAKDAALEAGYKEATVTEAHRRDGENVFEVKLEDESGKKISITVNGGSGEIVEFSTD